MANPTCFVVMGFGPKVDLATGRTLDMDKTYEFLIKPVLEDLSIDCVRADEIPHSGVIDVPMYACLYEADLVIADISTANANAIYELGVRHALKPYSTIVIAEDKLIYPFDLNHISIMRYVHLGSDIGGTTIRDFCERLKNEVEAVLAKKAADSPVYIYMKGLKQPAVSDGQAGTPARCKKVVPTRSTGEPFPVTEASADQQTLAFLTKKAEAAKENGEYVKALGYFSDALELDPNNTFLRQRMALCTYKAGLPDPMTALSDAEKLLERLSPETTTDPETLGLCGSINKRRYQHSNDKQYLQRSIRFYERGFYVKQDYYNGINVAYLYDVAAGANQDPKEAAAQRYLAAKIRQEVIAICKSIMQEEHFNERSDRPWVYLTLAEGYFGLGRTAEYQAVVNEIEEKVKTDPILKSDFNQEVFRWQLDRLKKLL